MAKKRSIAPEKEEIINSIVRKANIAGPCDSMVMIEMLKLQNTKKSIEELKIINNEMKKRVKNYRLITQSLEVVNLKARKALRSKSDTALKNAVELIKYCLVKAEQREEMVGVGVDDILIFLTYSQKEEIYSLFEEDKEPIKEGNYNNSDAQEEFLTLEEIQRAWGEEVTPDDVNRDNSTNILLLKET